VPDSAHGVTAQAELAEAGAPTGCWLPDETLFSIASRYHRLAGNRWASTTCEALFGHPRIGSAHDLPARIDEFAARTRGRLGTSTDIVWRRTILPFFLPYRSPAVAADAIAAMRGSGIASLKFRLGLLTSRFRADLPLKSCRACIERDIAAYNSAYWHRQHQLPGVWICPIDGCRLHRHEIKVSGQGKFEWVLPDDLPERQGPTNWSPEIRDRLERLASASQALGSMPPGYHLDTAIVANCHSRALALTGLLGPGNRLRLDELGEAYAAFATGLQEVPELATVPSDPAAARTQLSRMFYRPGDGAHPLRQLLLTIWLHGTWAKFEEAYDGLAAASGPLTADPKANSATVTAHARDPRVAIATTAVTEHERSPTSVAKELGVDVSTVVAWLASEGIAANRRPKKLKPPVFEAAVRLLETGASKAAVASQAGVSASTVTKLLRTQPGLRARWNDAKLSATRAEHRKAWQDLMGQNPLSPTPILRAVAARAYAWLYRNDRAWLSASIVARGTLPQSSAVRVDWDARDQALAAAVRRTAEQICASTGRQRCTVAAICVAVPDLRAKLGALDRLPLTARAIREVTWQRRRSTDTKLL